MRCLGTASDGQRRCPLQVGGQMLAVGVGVCQIDASFVFIVKVYAGQHVVEIIGRRQ